MKNLNILNNQKGAATLLTALVLLISITLVTFLTAKTVLVETQISADNYRMSQAVSAAQAGLDFGVGYFNGTGAPVVAGFDHDNNSVVDTLANRTYTSASGAQITTSSITFNNQAGTRCIAAGSTPNMKSGLITAVGRSDDGLAVRSISQCVSTADVFGGNAPKQTLISRGGVGLTGNYTVINRYYNTTAWAGNEIHIGASASASTFLAKDGSTQVATARANLADADLTNDSAARAILEDEDTTNTYTSPAISDRNKGNGVDSIGNDPSLSSLTSDQFFNNFFSGDRTAIKTLAANYNPSQVYPAANIGSASGKTGIVWIEGNATMNGGTYGTATSPVVMIINGNLRATGNPNINGMLYVTGQLDAAGTVDVLGSVVVEGNPTMVPTGEEAVVGHGGVDLIYSPYTLDKSTSPLVGTTTVVGGSWRDW